MNDRQEGQTFVRRANTQHVTTSTSSPFTSPVLTQYNSSAGNALNNISNPIPALHRNVLADDRNVSVNCDSDVLIRLHQANCKKETDLNNDKDNCNTTQPDTTRAPVIHTHYEQNNRSASINSVSSVDTIVDHDSLTHKDESRATPLNSSVQHRDKSEMSKSNAPYGSPQLPRDAQFPTANDPYAEGEQDGVVAGNENCDLVTVDVNNREANAPRGFPKNIIVTSKFTVITFIPWLLYIQFRRSSNFFFLLAAIISLIPGATAINPAANVAPLALVLIVNGIKNGIEDFRRHRADRKANSVPVFILKGDEFIEVKSSDVVPGDIIHMSSGDEIRCDGVLLASGNSEGVAYIETSQLDGETSAKTRRAPAICKDRFGNSDEMLATCAMNPVVYGAQPSPSLATWKGVLEIGNQRSSLTMSQLMLRGAVLRNTPWVIMVAVYVGSDTKLGLNLKVKPAKNSHFNDTINRSTWALFVLHQVLIILLSVLGTLFINRSPKGAWYGLSFLKNSRSGFVRFFFLYLANFVLLSYLIPISLFVTLEVVRALQAFLISRDQRMAIWDFSLRQWRFSSPKTVDLNEQLAHVRYIFTDKTGTLTENRMNLDQVYTQGRLHNEREQPGGLVPVMSQVIEKCNREALAQNHPMSWSEHLKDYDLHLFLQMLALCHSVACFESQEDSALKIYEGSSPDEIALVNAAARNGYTLISRDLKEICVEAFGEVLAYRIVCELEFTPERKRMSIILQAPDDRYLMFTKGADASMIPRRSSSCPFTTALVQPLTEELSVMAHAGLRTLVFAVRFLTEAETAAIEHKLERASLSITNRAEELERVYDEVERDFRLLGCTGVEDKLQEGVPRTLKYFGKAGVVVWMLTGDKRETAVTIAGSSGLVDPRHHTLHHLDVSMLLDCGGDDEQERMTCSACKQLEKCVDLVDQNPGKIVVVIDGITLDVLLREREKEFVHMGKKLAAAVCCRLTPLQKAHCVRLFQQQLGEPVLAVGDGANDVSMIQEAKVGIGIMGLEGSQAELAADFAIPKFRMLERLLSIHGRYSWYRNSTLTLYSFYKNVVLALCTVLYSFYSGFSGTSLYDSWLLSPYNVLFTYVMPFAIALFDMDVPSTIIEKHPQLYGVLYTTQQHFNLRATLPYIMDAFLHGFGAFYTFRIFMTTDDLSERHQGGLEHYSTAMFMVMLFVVDLTSIRIVSKWDPALAFSATLTIASIFIFIAALYTQLTFFVGESRMYKVFEDVAKDSKFWMWGLVVVTGMLCVSITRDYIWKRVAPTQLDNIKMGHGLLDEKVKKKNRYGGDFRGVEVTHLNDLDVQSQGRDSPVSNTSLIAGGGRALHNDDTIIVHYDSDTQIHEPYSHAAQTVLTRGTEDCDTASVPFFAQPTRTTTEF